MYTLLYLFPVSLSKTSVPSIEYLLQQKYAIEANAVATINATAMMIEATIPGGTATGKATIGASIKLNFYEQ